MDVLALSKRKLICPNVIVRKAKVKHRIVFHFRLAMLLVKYPLSLSHSNYSCRLCNPSSAVYISLLLLHLLNICYLFSDHKWILLRFIQNRIVKKSSWFKKESVILTVCGLPSSVDSRISGSGWPPQICAPDAISLSPLRLGNPITSPIYYQDTRPWKTAFEFYDRWFNYTQSTAF